MDFDHIVEYGWIFMILDELEYYVLFMEVHA